MTAAGKYLSRFVQIEPTANQNDAAKKLIHVLAGF